MLVFFLGPYKDYTLSSNLFHSLRGEVFFPIVFINHGGGIEKYCKGSCVAPNTCEILGNSLQNSHFVKWHISSTLGVS